MPVHLKRIDVTYARTRESIIQSNGPLFKIATAVRDSEFSWLLLSEQMPNKTKRRFMLIETTSPTEPPEAI